MEGRNVNKEKQPIQKHNIYKIGNNKIEICYLHFQDRIIDSPPLQSRRGSSFEACEREAFRSQGISESLGGWVPEPTRRKSLLSYETQ